MSIKKFPKLSKSQVVLARAKNSTGHALDSNFQIYSFNNQTQEIYTIFESLNEAMSYIESCKLNYPNVEFYVYDSSQKVIHTYFPARGCGGPSR